MKDVLHIAAMILAGMNNEPDHLMRPEDRQTQRRDKALEAWRLARTLMFLVDEEEKKL